MNASDLKFEQKFNSFFLFLFFDKQFFNFEKKFLRLQLSEINIFASKPSLNEQFMEETKK